VLGAAALGQRLARLGIALAERQPDSQLSGRAFVVLGVLDTPWMSGSGATLYENPIGGEN